MSHFLQTSATIQSQAMCLARIYGFNVWVCHLLVGLKEYQKEGHQFAGGARYSCIWEVGAKPAVQPHRPNAEANISQQSHMRKPSSRAAQMPNKVGIFTCTKSELTALDELVSSPTAPGRSSAKAELCRWGDGIERDKWVCLLCPPPPWQGIVPPPKKKQ